MLILAILLKRYNDICELLEYKIKNFNLSKQKEITYKIIINILREDKIYDVSNNEIENYIKNIKNNPNEYLLSLNPNYELNNSLIANKKSLNF